jgi:hypothetical protein
LKPSLGNKKRRDLNKEYVDETSIWINYRLVSSGDVCQEQRNDGEG